MDLLSPGAWGRPVQKEMLIIESTWQDRRGFALAQLVDHGQHVLLVSDGCVITLTTRTRFQGADKAVEALSFLISHPEELRPKPPPLRPSNRSPFNLQRGSMIRQQEAQLWIPTCLANHVAFKRATFHREVAHYSDSNGLVA